MADFSPETARLASETDGSCVSASPPQPALQTAHRGVFRNVSNFTRASDSSAKTSVGRAAGLQKKRSYGRPAKSTNPFARKPHLRPLLVRQGCAARVPALQALRMPLPLREPAAAPAVMGGSGVDGRGSTALPKVAKKRQNFVRMSTKHGKGGGSRFQSKAAASNKYRQSRSRGRFRRERAGDSAGAGASRRNVCYACGAEGHWARDCTARKDLASEAVVDEEACPAPAIVWGGAQWPGM
ncbi:hypothetical protein WJX81_003976 [Elliptochloris bilobata]|uniref:CCHC-type domain-containing protein n=1 Tax=Elliptochloris bilobata TaxID=381761 RepID=A0AAW1RPR2_9CHLO